MRSKQSLLLSFILASAVTVSGLAPAQASVPDENVANGQCDFYYADQGTGSATDPFIIKSAADLKELSDCNNRSKGIYSGIANEDGTATFQVETLHGAFGVGQNINIGGTESALFDATNVSVISSTADTITVKTSAPAGSITAGGSIQSYNSFAKLASDIDLSTPSAESWFNNTEISITGATKNSDNTITYVGANSLQGGEAIYIDGMGDKRFNQGRVIVYSATPTQFVTSISFRLADGEASAGGGTAHSQGWQPVYLENVNFDGAGHKISGLNLHNMDNYQGLFGYVTRSSIRNLTISDSLVDTTAYNTDDARERFGILAGYLERSTVENITIENSQVSAGGYFAGLLAGVVWGSTLRNISLEGSVKASGLSTAADRTTVWNQFGGAAGLLEWSTVKNLTANVSVNGTTVVQNSDEDAVANPTKISYLPYVGGLFGRTAGDSHIENATSTGAVVGKVATGGAIGEMGNGGTFQNIQASGNVTSSMSAQQTGELAYVGGFAGLLSGESVNTNLSASGNVSVTLPETSNDNIHHIGGFAGAAGGYGTNTKLKSSGTLSVNQMGSGEVSFVGGLIGGTDRLTLTDSINTSSVSVHAVENNVTYVGGVIGQTNCCSHHSNVKSTANVSVTIDQPENGVAVDVGGYIGSAGSNGSFTNISVVGSVSVSNGVRVGGFAGSQSGEVKFADVSVKGNVTSSYLGTEQGDNAANTGGLIGKTERVVLDRVSVVGNVTVTPIANSTVNNVGGLIGRLNASWTVVEIMNSQYRGNVSGTDYVGALIGYAPFEMVYRVEKTLVAAKVTATGTNPKVDNVLFSHFRDGSRSDFMDSTVAESATNGAGFISATTAALKSAATYTAQGWSFTGTSPWRISSTVNDGYPYLLAPSSDETVVNPPVDPPTTMKFTVVKSLAFSKKVVSLTTAQKKALTALAKTIASSSYTVVKVSAVPSSANFTLTGQRAANAQSYLAAALKKLKSNKTVGLVVVARSSGSSSLIRIVGGK